MNRKLRLAFISTAAALICSSASAGFGQDLLWQTMFDAGKTALLHGSYKESRKQLEAALKNAESFGPKDSRWLETVKLLARLSELEGKDQEAEQLYKRALAADTAVHGENDAAVAGDLCHLAATARHQSRYSESESLYKRAITIYEKHSKNSNPLYLVDLADLAATFVNLAMLYQEQGHYDEVEPLLNKAVSIYQDDKRDAELAQVLDSLAGFYVLQNRLAEAEPLYKRSMAIKEKSSPDSVTVAENLAGLGRLYQQQGKDGDAEELFKRAIAAREKQLGADDPAVAESLLGLAGLYRLQERFADAEPLFQRALSIQDKKLTPDDAKLGETLRLYALCELDQDKYAAAEPLLQRALKIDDQSKSQSVQTRAEDLNSLAMLYLRQGKYEQSEPLYQRALSDIEAAQGPSHPNAAACMNNLAWLYFNEGNFAQAEELLRKGLAIREKSLGADHPLSAQNMMNLAQVLETEKRFSDAEPLLKQALTVDENALGDDHESVAVAMSYLGQVYENENQLAQAEDSYRKLLARDEKVIGQGNPIVASDLDALARVLDKEGKRDEAGQLKRRSSAITGELPSSPHSLVGKVIGGASDAPEMANRPVADKWALVVGISNFQDSSLNLKYAAKDATDFRNYLIKEANFKPDHVKLLTDQKATRDNIVAYLGDKWMRRLANSDDLVVIYMSTHGSPSKKEVGANFVVPYEGNLDNIVFTGIPMQWLTAGLKDLVHCNRIVLLLDVCHGGAVMPGAKGLIRDEPLQLNQASIGVGQVVVAASQSDQLSWESRNYPNGVFTRRLIEGLRRDGDKTTLNKAYDYMKEKTEEEVLRDRAQLQTPVLMTRLWKGEDLVLQVQPTDPRPGLENDAVVNEDSNHQGASAATRSIKAQSKELKSSTHKSPRISPAQRGN